MPTISPISELCLRYGKYAGRNVEEGIHVFKKTDAKGNNVFTSVKNGELYKRVETLLDRTVFEENGIVREDRGITAFNYQKNIETKIIRELSSYNDNILLDSYVSNHSTPQGGEMRSIGREYSLVRSLEDGTYVTSEGIIKYNDINKPFGHLDINRIRKDNPDGTYTIETYICAESFIMPNGITKCRDTAYKKTFSADNKLISVEKLKPLTIDEIDVNDRGFILN